MNRKAMHLLHDSSEDAGLRRWNRSHEFVERIVPALKQRGYRFVGLGDVPAVQKAKKGGNRRLSCAMCDQGSLPMLYH